MPEGHRILAVDDSLTIRKALELILVPAGHALTFATTGAEALAGARQAPPDLILLDFILPDQRGSEVCRTLRADAATATVPVVLISARGAEIEQAYRDLPNVVRYLAKPFTPDDVLRIVAEAVAAPMPAPGADERGEEGAGAGRAAADAEATAAWHDEAETAPEQAPPPLAAALLAERTPAGSDTGAPASMPLAARPAEWLLEALRDGIEGVYVEEADTPGALADRAQSHTALATRLRAQLAAALEQAESGASHALCDDGSIRSLGETLLDGYRRFCRLLFRAAAAGVLAPGETGAPAPRVLVACHRDSPVHAPLARAMAEAEDWVHLEVAGDFRQLPALVRLFAPTHLVVDGTPGGPLWDQLAVLRRLPEGQRLACIGVLPDAQAAAAPALETTVTAGADLLAALRARVHPASEVAAA